MNIKIRLSRFLENQIREDLLRPHMFAFERVGFVSSTHSRIAEDDYVIILNRHHSVADTDYIKDRTVGARINGNAIRKAMQFVLDTENGMFHVHVHPFNGVPTMSVTDRKEIPPVVQNFRNVNQNSLNGILLLSNTHFNAFVSLPQRQKLVQSTNISTIGFPLFLNT